MFPTTVTHYLSESVWLKKKTSFQTNESEDLVRFVKSENKCEVDYLAALSGPVCLRRQVRAVCTACTVGRWWTGLLLVDSLLSALADCNQTVTVCAVCQTHGFTAH